MARKGEFKAEMVKAIADRSGISRKDAAAALDVFVSYVVESAKPGEVVSIPDPGELTASVRKVREGRNPRTSAAIPSPKKRVARFRRSNTTDALKIFTDTYKKL